MAKNDPRTLADVIKKIPLFDGLAPSQLRAVLSQCAPKRCQPGESLVERGGPSLEMYILVSGKLAILEDDLRVATIAPVTTVGEMGVITGHPRSATVEAVEPSHVLAIDKAKLDLLLRNEPAMKTRIFENIIGMLAGKLVSDNVRMRDYLSAQTRFEHEAEKLSRQLDAAVELLVEGGLDEEEVRAQIDNCVDRSTPMILVVDDEPVARRLVARGLSRYRTAEAGGAEEALRVLETQEAAIVLTDIRMPEMDGLQLLARLRAERPGLPVVAVSAFLDVTDLDDADFDAVLEKPVAVADVQKTVDGLIEADDD